MPVKAGIGAGQPRVAEGGIENGLAVGVKGQSGRKLIEVHAQFGKELPRNVIPKQRIQPPSGQADG